MQLDIKPINDETLDCLQSIIVSVATYWKREYSLMFSSSWGFEFDNETDSDKTILGKRISPGWKGDIWELLRQYHGIELWWCENADIEHILEVIKSNIEVQKLVVLALDAFWCPWDIAYKKYHNIHYCLVVGIEDMNNNLICIDPFVTCNYESLDSFHLKNGYERYCILSIDSDNKAIINWREIIRNAVTSINGSDGLISAFDSIRGFAKALENVLNINEETEGYYDIHTVPIFGQLKMIDLSRRNFAKVLKFLSEKFYITELQPLSEKITLAGVMWSKIRLKLMKLSMIPDQIVQRKKIADKIREIADYEESIANELLYLCTQTESIRSE